ncbi:MAG: cytochrome c-type biogenesis protein CcmH [Acidobacteria bacterium]|nr:cytochrome c-type biogenesis protein CcmH [Acidobacteriota bacterium]
MTKPFVWFTMAVIAALALPLLGELTPAEKARAANLQKTLLAPCCWSEPISAHRSEVALEMRAEVNRMVAAGKSDREILDHYKSRYGMRILIVPEGERSFWMYVIPPVAALAGLGWVVWVLRRWLRRRPQPSAG